MNEQHYEMSDSLLTVIDHELAIEFRCPFIPLYLPKSLSKKQEGLNVEKNQNGTIVKAYMVKNGKKEGECRLYYPNGEKRGQTFYLSGLLHGPSTFYSEEGALLSESWYVYGKIQGKMKQYYPGGQLSSLQRYKDGMREGKQEFYYESGALKTIMEYQKGMLHGNVTLFWPDGTIKREIDYLEGMKNGWDRVWNRNSVIIDEAEYQRGSPIGTRYRRYQEGTLKEELRYHTPAFYDQKQWRADGTLLYEKIFSPDMTFKERVWNEAEKSMVEQNESDSQ
jgi:antitoxin component YwqK of YwqJK toxin-antitoxin module